ADGRAPAGHGEEHHVEAAAGGMDEHARPAPARERRNALPVGEVDGAGAVGAVLGDASAGLARDSAEAPVGPDHAAGVDALDRPALGAPLDADHTPALVPEQIDEGEARPARHARVAREVLPEHAIERRAIDAVDVVAPLGLDHLERHAEAITELDRDVA